MPINKCWTADATSIARLMTTINNQTIITQTDNLKNRDSAPHSLYYILQEIKKNNCYKVSNTFKIYNLPIEVQFIKTKVKNINQMKVQETYKTKFSSATEYFLDSCILPYSHQWRYILEKYRLIKSNVCIKPTYEGGFIWVTVIGIWHPKLVPCINQSHCSLHYVLIYCLLESVQLIIIKVLET